MAVKWLREKCLFLPDYCPFGGNFGRRGVRRDATPSHSRAPGNIWVRVRVSFTTGAVRSDILATAGLLVCTCVCAHDEIEAREARDHEPRFRRKNVNKRAKSKQDS